MLPAADPPLAERLWLFAGKLHPLGVHFPIALILAAALLEFVRFRRGAYSPSPAGVACIVLGGLSAVASAAMGWSDAETSGHSGSDPVLAWHRWLSVAVAVLASVAAVLAPIARVRRTRRPFVMYRLGLVGAAMAVAVTGHLGGSLVHGRDYIDRALAYLSSGPAPVTLVSADSRVDFEKDIRPIFARRCFHCHTGEDPESDRRLDSREGVLAGGASGVPAIVPGRADESRLIALVSGAEVGTTMPPKGAPLDDESVRLLRLWIDQGAHYTRAGTGEPWHWAFRAPARPNPPPVKDTHWPRNPIDHFVLARLEAEGLRPSPGASREELIRRASLDLTGLPPTVRDVDEFLADPRHDAFERLVDRLLASPHYGERFARPWLDLARYADTHGYEKDNRRVAWPFRDWVIDAFNRDEPFDRFSTDQLAGDLIPGRTREQLIATGFHRNTMINEEGGVDPEEFRAETIIDRVNTTGATWLGLTVACAQCHDHKFDPITQEDYFRLYAIFNSCEADTRPHQFGVDAAGAMVTVPKRGREAEYDKAAEELAAVEARYESDSPELSAAQDAWEREYASVLDAWRIVPIVDARSNGGAAFTVRSEGSVSASGPNAEKDTYDLTLGTCRAPRGCDWNCSPTRGRPGSGATPPTRTLSSASSPWRGPPAPALAARGKRCGSRMRWPTSSRPRAGRGRPRTPLMATRRRGGRSPPSPASRTRRFSGSRDRSRVPTAACSRCRSPTRTARTSTPRTCASRS